MSFFSLNKAILLEDSALVVLNKPAGVLTIPDRYHTELPNLKGFLERKFGKIFPIHRLDKETSGVILFAKDPDTHKFLNTQFQNRSVSKKYLALVDGIMEPEQGVIDRPIAPSKRPGLMTVHPKGKPAHTEYRVLEKFGRFSLVELEIKTGRTHQIRVHLQAKGYPLAVDSVYGKRDAIFCKRYQANPI